MTRVGTWIATLAVAGVLIFTGCEDGSADPGAACVESGGVCSGSTGACRESLPYPCPDKQSCCAPQSMTPATQHDAGGQ